MKTFSKTKCVKSEHQAKLTDKHLKAIFLVGCTNIKPNLDNILRNKRQFYKSPKDNKCSNSQKHSRITPS